MLRSLSASVLLYFRKREFNSTPLWGSEAKPRVLNDSPVDCQTQRCPSPQARLGGPSETVGEVVGALTFFVGNKNLYYGVSGAQNKAPSGRELAPKVTEGECVKFDFVSVDKRK